MYSVRLLWFGGTYGLPFNVPDISSEEYLCTFWLFYHDSVCFSRIRGFPFAKRGSPCQEGKGRGTKSSFPIYAAKTGHPAAVSPLRGISVRAANADCEEGPEDAPLGLLVSYGYFTA